ncbi:MAG: GTPase family protein [Campylobacter sp.]
MNLVSLNNAISAIGIRPYDVLVGATGAGKSSTINSYFLQELAIIGRGADPQTMQCKSYRVNENLRIHDSPGFGDSPNNDRAHAEKITKLLKFALIDMCVVIVDASLRDLGTTYWLIDKVLKPNLSEDRILIALNQADIAMKGRGWDEAKNAPTPKLRAFLDEKARSIHKRIMENNFNSAQSLYSLPQPVYYSAQTGYNVDKFFDFIIENLPKQRRIIDF